jgi:hypothetical protein
VITSLTAPAVYQDAGSVLSHHAANQLYYSVTLTAAVGSYDYNWNWGACLEPIAPLRVNSARGLRRPAGNEPHRSGQVDHRAKPQD